MTPNELALKTLEDLRVVFEAHEDYSPEERDGIKVLDSCIRFFKEKTAQPHPLAVEIIGYVHVREQMYGADLLLNSGFIMPGVSPTELWHQYPIVYSFCLALVNMPFKERYTVMTEVYDDGQLGRHFVQELTYIMNRAANEMFEWR